MSSFSSLACNCQRKSSRAIHSTFDDHDDHDDHEDDEDEDEDDFNLAAMKCDSDDEDNGHNGSNDMKRHLGENHDYHMTYDQVIQSAVEDLKVKIERILTRASLLWSQQANTGAWLRLTRSL